MINMSVEGIMTITLIAIILWIILREVFCWYWKINAMKTIMEEQRDLLKKLVDKEVKGNSKIS